MLEKITQINSHSNSKLVNGGAETPFLSNRLALSTAEQIYMVDLSEIIRIEASNNYSYVYLQGQTRKLISKTLKDFELQLSRHGFLRIHQSHLVNFQFIRSYEKKSGNLLLVDGTELPVSLRKREELVRNLKHFVA